MFAATAGEDFELCVCIPGPALETALASGATEVGRVVAGAGTVSVQRIADEAAQRIRALVLIAPSSAASDSRAGA